jgi:hypothetical protein
MKDTTVADLIAYLQTKPQDMVVIHSEHSEYVVLDLGQCSIENLCVAREDGWVQNYRPDMPTQQYLALY